MTDPAFVAQLQGCELTTAEIHYYMPDHPSLLQLFIWQEYDEAPDFPALCLFLDYWRREIDAPLHSVRVTHRRRRLGPPDWRSFDEIIEI